MPEFITDKIIFFLILVISISIHEFGHAFASYKLGDPTPRNDNRVTLNPISHIDLFGTVLFPIIFLSIGITFLLGWGKPVLVNSRYYKNRSVGEIIVSFAGPLTNLMLCFLGTVLYVAFAKDFLAKVIFLNSCLFVFNLIPIPPLDGSKILKNTIKMSESTYQQLSHFSWITIPLFVFTPLSAIFLFVVNFVINTNFRIAFLLNSLF